MTDPQHPISPPPEMVREWCEQLFGCPDEPEVNAYELAHLAAQWGADRVLSALAEGDVVGVTDGTRTVVPGRGRPTGEAGRPLARATGVDQAHHPRPIPVAERLPTAADCNTEGQCWWFNPGQHYSSNPHIATSSWRLTHMMSGKPMGSHWLPADAISLPETTND